MKYFKRLSDNEVFAYPEDGSQDDLIDETLKEITKAEALAQGDANYQAYFDSLPYNRKREMKYPAIAEQLDIIYHKGIDAWKAVITSVKEEYPKP